MFLSLVAVAELMLLISAAAAVVAVSVDAEQRSVDVAQSAEEAVAVEASALWQGLQLQIACLAVGFALQQTALNVVETVAAAAWPTR